MNRLLFFPLLLAMITFACSPCSKLQQRDDALTFSFESLRNQYLAGGLPEPAYIFELKKLREKELELLEDASACEFESQRKANYWNRSRLKFPSRIELELERLEKENQTR